MELAIAEGRRHSVEVTGHLIEDEEVDGVISFLRANGADLLVIGLRQRKIDRLTDQVNTLAEHADATVQNVNGTVTDTREPLQNDLTELQTTLQQAKALLTDMQVVSEPTTTRLTTQWTTCARQRTTSIN